MRAPLIAYVAIASQALPLAAGAAARPRLNAPRRFVMAWCALLVVIDAVAFMTARVAGRNLWIGQVFAATEATAILWAMSYWQAWPLARIAVRAAIPLYALTWVILLVTVESRHQFSTVVEPIYMILGLLVAAFTLVTGSTQEGERPVRRDWFWVCAGLALYFGTNAALSPLAAVLVEQHPQVVIRAFLLKCASDIVAFTVIAFGILCPPTPSGVSTSPPS